MTTSLARALTEALAKHGEKLTADQRDSLTAAAKTAEHLDDDDPFAEQLPDADVAAYDDLFR